ncbi:unnamed protein product, partial [Ixodes persulcatus]
WELKRSFVLRLTRYKLQLTSGVILLRELVGTTKSSQKSKPQFRLFHFTN